MDPLTAQPGAPARAPLPASCANPPHLLQGLAWACGAAHAGALCAAPTLLPFPAAAGMSWGHDELNLPPPGTEGGATVQRMRTLVAALAVQRGLVLVTAVLMQRTCGLMIGGFHKGPGGGGRVVCMCWPSAWYGGAWPLPLLTQHPSSRAGAADGAHCSARAANLAIGERLRLVQVLAPALAPRAHIFANVLALKPDWVCTDPPFFLAPGVRVPTGA